MKKKIFLLICSFAMIFGVNSVFAEEPTDEALIDNIENKEVESSILDTSSYTEDFKKFIEDVDKYLVDSDNMSLSSTENTLKIKSVFEDKEYETNFVYENGVLKYVLNTDLDSLVVDTAVINTLFDLYCSNNGYDINVDWLLKQYNLTIEKNGISYQVNTLGSEEEDGLVVVDFAIDIKNGIKSSQDDATLYTENPETGIYYASGVLGIIALIGGSIYLISRKHSKFPQA